MSRKISEQAVLLGPTQSLVGILTRPVAAAAADIPAIVILNTGIIHRVGHHRMFVAMSRVLANFGYTVLRFDFSGIGDSDPRDDGLSPVAGCMADIKEALDWLERDRHISRVVLVGLCSGADYAVLYGHTDDRVVALVVMDPSIPATFRHYVGYVAGRLTSLGNWISVVTGKSRFLRVLTEHMLHILWPEREARRLALPGLIFREDVELHYQDTVDRGILILAVLTEDTTRQTYREQLLEALPNVSFKGNLRLEFFPGSDHTFTLESDRSRLTRLILEWLASTHGHGGPRVLSVVDRTDA